MQKKETTQKPVGQHMLKLLTDKEQQMISGGPKYSPVGRPVPNGCTGIGNGGSPCRR